VPADVDALLEALEALACLRAAMVAALGVRHGRLG
jgi:hypothetical protein